MPVCFVFHLWSELLMSRLDVSVYVGTTNQLKEYAG